MVRVVVLLMVLIQMSHFARAQYYSNPNMSTEQKEVLRKVKQYTKLKQTGFKLLGGGAATTVLGIVLIASADYETDPYTGQTTTEDASALLGILGVVYIGIPLIATGTTLAIIGNAKEKSYMRKLDGLSASYFHKHGANGIRLAYNF